MPSITGDVPDAPLTGARPDPRRLRRQPAAHLDIDLDVDVGADLDVSLGRIQHVGLKPLKTLGSFEGFGLEAFQGLETC